MLKFLTLLIAGALLANNSFAQEIMRAPEQRPSPSNSCDLINKKISEKIAAGLPLSEDEKRQQNECIFDIYALKQVPLATILDCATLDQKAESGILLTEDELSSYANCKYYEKINPGVPTAYRNEYDIFKFYHGSTVNRPPWNEPII